MDNQSRHARLYTPAEAYQNLYHAVLALPAYRKLRSMGLLPDEFKERIMLAVTEVNGCALCSYGHTQMALESGMDAEEIKSLLGGEMDDVPDEELPAVLFAQHYAEERGVPLKSTWDLICKTYGKRKSLAILTAIQVIMAGNTYGIPMGSLSSRFRPNENVGIDTRSSLGYELFMAATVLPFLAVAFLQAAAVSVGKGCSLYPKWKNERK